ncbi:hypothetical protein BpHYR1_013955 [Brachionus plicatilis]|uniref:Uncharacterized protein n=1 Tax=Brachionus plicatilis TaxID=10195 RepID=A0A3M7R2T2_BRAPC|nr:hypothetical protein BpHYR1_013955 [Brachionus plicatilis]
MPIRKESVAALERNIFELSRNKGNFAFFFLNKKGNKYHCKANSSSKSVLMPKHIELTRSNSDFPILTLFEMSNIPPSDSLFSPCTPLGCKSNDSHNSLSLPDAANFGSFT